MENFRQFCFSEKIYDRKQPLVAPIKSLTWKEYQGNKFEDMIDKLVLCNLLTHKTLRNSEELVKSQFVGSKSN